MTGDDPFDLRRFVEAQASVYDMALDEMESGQKRSHWMWFIFPQLRGLGRSPTAQMYGVDSLAEARAYLANPLLGARLRECVEAALAHGGRPLIDIFGSPDDLKFRSSMTLFARAAGPGEPLFQTAIDQLCGGRADPATLELFGDEAISRLPSSGRPSNEKGRPNDGRSWRWSPVVACGALSRRRPPLRGRRSKPSMAWSVASEHRAAEIGAEILRQGGNAIDAAVAVGFAEAVTNPCCGNLGGGGFLVVHLAASHRDVFIDFRETAPAAATKTMYLDAAGAPIKGASLDGWRAVATPGTVLGLDAALKEIRHDEPRQGHGAGDRAGA